MAFKDIVALVVVAILLAIVALVAKRSSNREPPQRSFRCGRCNAMTYHSDRTVKAWRADKTRLFCSKCHGHWLKSQPPRPEEAETAGYQGRHGYRGKTSAGGRIGLFIVLGIGTLIVRACTG